MTIYPETLFVVSIMLAVFAATATLGCSIVFGVSFERLRAGFEILKKQTAFFSDAIHKLDKRVDSVEKQGGYFFEAITALEQKAEAHPEEENAAEETAEAEADDGAFIITDKSLGDESVSEKLLTQGGFVLTSKQEDSSDQGDLFEAQKEQISYH